MYWILTGGCGKLQKWMAARSKCCGASLVVIVVLSELFASCSKSIEVTSDRLAGTESACPAGLGLSVSDDEAYVLFVCTRPALSNSGAEEYFLESLDLRTGEVVEHSLGPDSIGGVRDLEVGEISSNLLSFFRPRGWILGTYYVDYFDVAIAIAPPDRKMIVERNPYSVLMRSKVRNAAIPLGAGGEPIRGGVREARESPNRVATEVGLSCSDCVSLGDICTAIEDGCTNGALDDGAEEWVLSRDYYYSGKLAMGKDDPENWLYYVVLESGDAVAVRRCRADDDEEVWNSGSRDSQIRQIRLSTDGRYLAITTQIKQPTILPSPLVRNEMQVVDVVRDDEIYRQTYQELGGMMWGGTSGKLYYVAQNRGSTGVYVLQIARSN